MMEAESLKPRRAIFFAAATGVVITLAACGGSDGSGAGNTTPTTPTPTAVPVLSSVGIDAPSGNVPIGGTIPLTGVGRDQNGVALNATLTWSSSNDAIARVSASGIVTAVGAGAATVRAVATAGASNVMQDLQVNVMPPYSGPPPPDNVLVNDPHRAAYPALSQHEPSIAVFGSKVVVGWIDKSISGPTIRGVDFGVAYGNSLDAGATFIDRGRLGETSWGFDPSVAVDRLGNFYIARGDLETGSPSGASSPDRVGIYKSTDGGTTFSGSSGVTGNSGATPGINDKPTITADNSGERFSGNLYVSWTFARSNVLSILFSRSTNGGASFSPPISLSSGPLDQSSIPVTGPNGEVYVVWLENNNSIIFAKSTDGGVTFNIPVRIAQLQEIGNASVTPGCGNVLNGEVRARSWPSMAVDRSGGAQNGKVYVVFSARASISDNADVFLVSSSDGGASWADPVRMNDDATSTDQWLPFVVAAPNGTVAVSWYDRRLDPQNKLIDVFMRTSLAGGTSFGASRKITSVPFPPPAPSFNCYLSSYSYMTADASNFYLVWTDTRMVTRGGPDPNIFFAKIPY